MREATGRSGGGEASFRSLLKNVLDIVAILDADGTLRYVSPAIETMLGYRPEEVTGTAVFHYVHPDDLEKALEALAETLVRPGVLPPLEFRARRVDGSWRHVEVVRNNRLDDPDVGGVVINVRDITQRKVAEEALRQSERSLANAQRLAHIGNFEYSIEQDEALWSDEMYRIFGYAPQRFVPTYKIFLRSVHPDDKRLIRSSVRKALYEEDQGSVDYRIVRPDGQVRMVQSHYEVVRRAPDRAVKLVGTVHDITEREEAEKRRREAEERYRVLVETVPAVTYTDRANGTYPNIAIYTSPQIEALVGYSAEEWLDPTRDLWQERLHPEDRAWVLAADARSKSTGEPFGAEYRLLAKDGRVVWVRDEAALMRGENGEPLYWQGVLVDVTDRKEVEEALRRSEERYRAVVEEQTELVCRFLPDLTITFANGAYCRYFGLEAEEVIGKSFLERVAVEDRVRYEQQLAWLDEENPTRTVEHRVLTPGGGVRWQQWTDTALFDGQGRVVEYQSVGRDVTERREAEERLARQAFRDSLTDLPNRRLFVDRLGQALRRTRRRGERNVAVLFMDLNHFKTVNDSLGHEVGDRLLVAVADRLRGCLRPEDTLARFGGDEFVVLIEDVQDLEDAVRVAERIVEVFRAPFRLQGRDLFVAASIGIALGSARWKRPEDLLRDADTAMYRAKEEAGSGYRVFDPPMHERVLARLELENDIRRALEQGEFRLFYQPKVRIEREDKVAEVEALLRWEHPQRGILMPEEFIGLAEETGLIVPLGRWVLKETCRQVKEWQDRYPKSPPLVACVNISAGQIRRLSLLEDVGSALRESGVEARSLALEITESALVKDMATSMALLKDLRKAGVRFALDDFGSEYSSLSYLMQLPVDFVKIDKSFVWSLGVDPRAEVIVEAIISLAHSLGLEAVGEGVESAEQLERLRNMGCDLAQGYYLAPPMSSEELDRLLADRKIS